MGKETTRLLTIPEAAQCLALKEATIRRRILEKRIGYVKLGRSVRIPVEVVERLCKDGYVPAIKNSRLSESGFHDSTNKENEA
jgi:excisionase family DNA binding protein